MASNPKIYHYLLFLFTFLNALFIIAFPASETKTILTDLAIIALGIVILFILWSTARRMAIISRHISRSWYLLFLAHLANVIADILWAYFEIILHTNPFPSWADFFYLVFYPLFFIAIILMASDDESGIRRMSTWLDIGLVFASTFLFIWILIIYPLLTSVADEPLLLQALCAAYPIGDLLLLSAVIVLIYKHSASLPPTLVLLAANSLVLVFTDLIFSYQSLYELYFSGNWLDLGWVIAYLFMGLAALFQFAELPTKGKTRLSLEENKQTIWFGFFAFFRTLLPYLWAIMVLIFMQFSYTSGRFTNLPFLFSGMWVIVLLILLRQYLSLRENLQLSQHLQATLANIRKKEKQGHEINIQLQEEIKKRKKLSKQLEYNALHDPLTKLPNRTLFMDRLEHALAISKRHPDYSFSVFFIDLDNFKDVNDKFGHSVGDQVLAIFAKYLYRLLRKSDTLARLGGDEFAILMENNSNPDSYLQVAERIYASTNMPYQVGNEEIYLSASIGLVRETSDYSDASEIIRAADYAMYRAKEKEKGSLMLFSKELLKDENEIPKIKVAFQAGSKKKK